MTTQPHILSALHLRPRAVVTSRFLRLAVWLILAGGVPAVIVGQPCQSAESQFVLNPGQAISRTLNRNEKHTYQITLAPRQYLRVLVQQKGIDVTVAIFDPNMVELLRRDSPNGKFGPENISTITTSPGTYKVEICADQNQPAGSYELRTESLREPTGIDEKRVAAELLVVKAQAPQPAAQAIEQLQQAVAIWREIGDVGEEGYALTYIGERYRGARHFVNAEKYLPEALAKLTDAHDLSGQAYVLNAMGAAQRDLGDPMKALPLYERALELRSSLGDRWGRAQLLNNLAVVYSNTRDDRKALQFYESALNIWRDLGVRNAEMQATNNIARSNLNLGNLSDAFTQATQVIEFCQSNGGCLFEPHARNTLGIIHDTRGEPHEAIAQYQTALQQATLPDLKAAIRENMGMALTSVGETEEALHEFQEALKLREGFNDASGQAITKSNIGYALILSEKYTEAIEQLRQALELSRSFRRPDFEAYTLMRMGVAQVALIHYEEALASYNEALRIQERIEDRRGQAITLDKIAEVNSLMGQSSQSLQNYRKALERWRIVGDVQGEALSLVGIAGLARNQNRLVEARDRIIEAIDKVESLRTKMTSHRLRMSYFAAKQNYYELEIDIRMRLYNATQSREELELALFASERARARNLLDLLNESHIDIRHEVPEDLLERERTLRARQDEKMSQLLTLLTRQHTAEEKRKVDRDLQDLTFLLDQTQANIRKRSPRYAALTRPQLLRLSEIQKRLDDDTQLLQFALGEEQSYLWVITRTDVQPYTLPRKALIAKATTEFRDTLLVTEQKSQNKDTFNSVERLRRAAEDYPKRALELSRMLLGPAAGVLTKKRLVIVPDGILQFVPFAALPVPNARRTSGLNANVLIAKHEIVYEPSASALALIRSTKRTAALKTLAVFADPVFHNSDERVRTAAKESGNGVTPALSRDLGRTLRDVGDIGTVDAPLRLDRLRFSTREANAIVAAAQSGSVMKAIGFDASRTKFLTEDLKQFKLVHIATHGILNNQRPELSGLVFSLVDQNGRPADGFLRLADIYNLNLPVEMVVLSACRTGLGRLVQGEGLVGLTRGFMHAGSARVVASLWNAEDEPTAELMKLFYDNMLRGKMSAAAALRRAQLDLMRSRPSPYSWAGFVIQGEWR